MGQADATTAPPEHPVDNNDATYSRSEVAVTKSTMTGASGTRSLR